MSYGKSNAPRSPELSRRRRPTATAPKTGDYIYGKKRLREIDSRVRFLRKRLDALQIVEGPLGDRNKAWFGAWVTLEDEEGAEQVWRIVGPDEFDVSQA